MRILKAPERWYCVKAKSRSRDFAELGTSARGAVIGEADEALVESSVPQCRQQETIVDVEPLLVAAPVRARISSRSSLPHRAVAMPMAPQECIDVPGAEAVDSLGHLALERKPPHFAVGHDVEPRCLLKADGLITARSSMDLNCA